jgi:hypothetical protein
MSTIKNLSQPVSSANGLLSWQWQNIISGIHCPIRDLDFSILPDISMTLSRGSAKSKKKDSGTEESHSTNMMKLNEKSTSRYPITSSKNLHLFSSISFFYFHPLTPSCFKKTGKPCRK